VVRRVVGMTSVDFEALRRCRREPTSVYRVRHTNSETFTLSPQYSLHR